MQPLNRQSNIQLFSNHATQYKMVCFIQMVLLSLLLLWLFKPILKWPIVKAHVTLTSNITLHTKCYNLKKSNIMLSDPLHQHQTKKHNGLLVLTLHPTILQPLMNHVLLFQ